MLSNNAAYLSIGNQAGGIGVANISGGLLVGNKGLHVGDRSTGILNVSGSANIDLTGGPLDFGLAASTSTGTANLLGGTVKANNVGVAGTSTSRLNFNGGTLKAAAASATFIAGLTAATIYSGGAVIDDGGFALTNGQALLAPAGSGVNGITVATGGSGYLDTPVVSITGGGGVGATAVATISGGAVTGFTITSPGTGYTSVPTVTLTGGGYSSAATSPTATTAANTSGGLTKQGSGTLALTAANTYTGNTLISAGTLSLNAGGSVASSVISVAGGATFDVSGLTTLPYSLGSQTLTNSSTGTASINGSLTTGSGTVSLAYVSGTPSLTVPSGTFTVSSGTTFKVSTATTLGQGSYKLISKSGSGTVAAGTLPAVTVGGAGVAAGALTSLSVSGGELYLNVSSPLTANPNTYTRNGSVTWMLKVANLMTNVTELDVTTTNLTSVGTSTNGVTLDITSIPGYVLYNNPNLVDDKFSYTVTDGNGWTDTATITLTAGTVPSVGGQANNINYSGGTATLTFAGIPGYKYNVQLNTVDVSNPLDWSTVFTTNAPMGGVFQYVDPTPPTPNAYYRLMWNGN